MELKELHSWKTLQTLPSWQLKAQQAIAITMVISVAVFNNNTMFYNVDIIWWVLPLPNQAWLFPSVSFLKNKQNKWTTLGASKSPECTEVWNAEPQMLPGAERAPRLNVVARCPLMVADLVWRAPKNGSSHGTQSISYPWSSTSFLVVFWQVRPCSRPESGSPETHENKQCMKMIFFNTSSLKYWLGLYHINNINSCWYIYFLLPTNTFLDRNFH